MSTFKNVKNKLKNGYYLGKTANLVNTIDALESGQEPWTVAWEKCIVHFEKIKDGLERVKEMRKEEFTRFQHQAVINKVLEIFEVL